MFEIHRLPEGMAEVVAREREPVKVKRLRDSASSLESVLLGQKNILAIWKDFSYRALSFGFSMVNQPYFVCNGPDTVRRVFLEEHDNYDRKSPQMRHALEPLLGDGLFVSDGALWKERRAYCEPAFEADLMPHYAAIMVESAVEVAERWHTQAPDQPLDMLNEMARLTARIIGRTVFGDDTSDAEAAQVVAGFSDYQTKVEQLSFADAFGLPWLRWIRNPWRKKQAALAGAKVHEIINRIIERRENAPESDSFSLLAMFLEGRMGRGGKQSGCPLGKAAARNEAIVMFMAGHETTANSLAWTWYLLDHSPRALACLQEELHSVLGGRTPTLDDVANLPYTKAVFEEALRLYPPVPVLSRQSREADIMRDRTVPKDSVILVVPWLLHRHERYWEKPDAFIPERFLPGQPRPDKFIYLPFSVGRRVCIGLRFGLTEGILCLATLAQQYRPRMVKDHRVEIECRLTLRPKDGLPMLVEKRA